jgi:hypothetical protein
MPEISSLTVKRSELDNLNTDGTPNCRAGPVVTRWHPEFFSCIEEGVRDLVEVLVSRMDCITYSSCQGHPGVPGGVIARERCVGIVPRDQAELESVLAVLEQAARNTNLEFHSQEVQIVLDRDALTSDGSSRACIDVRFACLRDVNGYFRELEPMYRHFLDELRRDASSATDDAKSSKRSGS